MRPSHQMKSKCRISLGKAKRNEPPAQSRARESGWSCQFQRERMAELGGAYPPIGGLRSRHPNLAKPIRHSKATLQKGPRHRHRPNLRIDAIGTLRTSPPHVFRLIAKARICPECTFSRSPAHNPVRINVRITSPDEMVSSASRAPSAARASCPAAGRR